MDVLTKLNAMIYYSISKVLKARTLYSYEAVKDRFM